MIGLCHTCEGAGAGSVISATGAGGAGSVGADGGKDARLVRAEANVELDAKQRLPVHFSQCRASENKNIN